jgi:m7GpppX diphosphatase
MRNKSLEIIETKYGIKKNKIRAYLHYQPSFYHLHVHFTHIKFQIPGIPERNHNLSQVIENLKIDREYYRKTSLTYPIKKNDALFELYKDRFE